MINHQVQLSLFALRSREFKDTESSKATYKLNQFIANHNQRKTSKGLTKPVDIKYNVDDKTGRTSILLMYVPVAGEH